MCRFSLMARRRGRRPQPSGACAPGPHQLALVKDGYEVYERDVAVTAAATELVAVTMKPLVLPLPQLPVVFRAIHQHRLGTCIGTMTVTAESIEFVGDTKEDVFRIPIRTVRSVARSFGPVPGMGPMGINGATSMMACRIEASDRSYGSGPSKRAGMTLSR